MTELIKPFVDEVFKMYPNEAPKMTQMAAAGDMGFGLSDTRYGKRTIQDGKPHSVF